MLRDTGMIALPVKRVVNSVLLTRESGWDPGWTRFNRRLFATPAQTDRAAHPAGSQIFLFLFFRKDRNPDNSKAPCVHRSIPGFLDYLCRRLAHPALPRGQG